MPALKSIIRLGVWWAALGIGFACCLGVLNVPRLYRVATNPVLAEADVLTTDCANQGIVFYSYTAANEDHIGYSYLGQGCSRLEPGERIHVYLSQVDPSLSEAGNPRAALINELTTVALAAIFAASFIVILALLRYGRATHRDTITEVAQVVQRNWTIKGRNRFLVAVTTGVFIQALLMLLAAQFPEGGWQVPMAPGQLTVMAIWGTHGPVSDDRAATAITLGVDIIFYSLVALAVIRLINYARSKLSI